MSAYIVKKRFEQFHPGDVLKLNDRQAKYLLMSNHINHIDAVNTAKKEPEPKAEPMAKGELSEETDASKAGKKKVKNG